jgi:hypothetical protein
VKQNKNGTFCFENHSISFSRSTSQRFMQRGKRGVDAAHPGLLDDEEEAAEGLAGVEEEGGRVVDDEDVDELELLPALASLRKTRMKKAGTSDWPADTQRRGAGPGRRAGSMMSATKTSESRDVEHELLERTATVGGCCGRGCGGACWGDGVPDDEVSMKRAVARARDGGDEGSFWSTERRRRGRSVDA